MLLRLLTLSVSASLLFIVASCLTFNPDDDLLLNKLDDAAKARALVDAGSRVWENWVVAKDAVDRIPEVTLTIQAALRFDPLSSSAQKWLTTIEEYRAVQIRQNISEARSLSKKTPRRDEDDFVLAVSLQRAFRMDPWNAEVHKLLAETTEPRDRALKLYSGKASAVVEKANKTKDESTQERLRIEAYNLATKALSVDPYDPNAHSIRSSLSQEFRASVAAKLETLPKLIEGGKFSNARAQIDAISTLNDKLNDVFASEVSENSYSLYFKWATWLVGQKDWQAADSRIGTALSFKKSPEAVALLQKIAAQRNQTDKSVPFETSLQSVDSMIADGDLSTAQRAISNLTANAKDDSQQSQLDIRKKKIRSALADSYARAVQLYRSESFGSAIEAFKEIIAVDSGYEQAADYLDKAKAKKKMLDQY